MSPLSRRVMQAWMSLGPRYLPFADVATPDLPLHRLFRLSLFQVSVGMTMVLLVGTLNRVMIVELGVSATLVSVMVALPLLIAPMRALIGFSSDHHRSELGWRRIPFIWKGTMAQFAGYAVMPFALLVLAGKGHSGNLPDWVGQLAAAAAFLMVGGGAHVVQTAGLALATDLTPSESHPRVVGLMYVMLLLGMILSASAYGWLLADFNAAILVQVIQGTALMVMILNVVAMWKQEVRRPARNRPATAPDPTFRESWATFCEGDYAVRRLIVVGVGTLAFGLADVLIEPFGGQILDLGVAHTTSLTALFAGGGLAGFALASRVIAKGMNPHRVSMLGAAIGLPGFALILTAAPLGANWPFQLGNVVIGFGGALFAHGTLTVAMSRAPKAQAGMAIGAWGAVQATAAGLATGASGVIRDVVQLAIGGSNLAVGYNTVYVLEMVLLLVTIGAIVPLLRGGSGASALSSEAPATADAL